MLNPGDIVQQKYQVVRLLGQGGMSNIYLCRQVGSPNAAHWVLKEMTVTFRDPEDQRRAVQHFEREAQILQRLQHRNLPRVIDLFTVGNRYYFVMEFVEGEDLGHLLARHPDGLPEHQVVHWGVEIATVLYYLHSQKPPIIFRDVKPSNIMISKGSVKLIDFGIARHFDPFKKKDTMRIGSPGYAPPEQYSGQTDPRSDIYSLGVTLHQLITGRDPTETQTPFKLPSVRSLRPTASAPLEAIIEKATDMDQTKRYRSALDMKRALQALAPGQQTAAPLGGPPKGGTTPHVAPTPVPAKPLPAKPVPEVRAPAPARPAASAGNGGGAAPRPTPAPSRSAPPPATPVPAANVPPAKAPTPPPAAAKNPPRPRFGWLFRAPSPPVVSGPGGVSVPASKRQPKRRGLALWLLLILLAVGGSGYVYQAQIQDYIVALLEPAGSPTPPLEPGPFDDTHRALALADSGRLDEALTVLDAVRLETPDDGLALLAQNNALARAIPGETVALQLDFPSGSAGPEWLRGVALAQREVNKQGGVQGRRLVLRPVEYAYGPQPTPPPTPDSKVVGGYVLPNVQWLADEAQRTDAVASLAWLPVACVDEAAQAWAKTDVPLIVASARPTGTQAWSPAPRPDAVVKALAQVPKILEAHRVAVVVLPSGVSAYGSLEEAVRRAGATVRAWRPADVADVPSDLSGFKPDLVMVAGDALTSARWIAAARESGLAGGFVATPALHAEPTTALGARALKDLVGEARLWVVSPRAAEPSRVEDVAVGLGYRRLYGVSSGPAGWAWSGYDSVMALTQAMRAGGGVWTRDGVREALHRAAAVPASPSPMYLLRFQDGSWTAVKALVP